MSVLRLVGSAGASIHEQQKVDWIATRTEGTLHWSALRVLAVLGWAGVSKDSQPFVGFRTQRKSQYRLLCERFGLNLDTHFQVSARSIKAKARARNEDPDEVQAKTAQLSTLALYMMLCSYVTSRQSSHHRELARSALWILIGQTTDLEFDEPSHLSEFTTLCHETVNEDNHCEHVARVMKDFSSLDGRRTDALISVASRACSEKDCAACTAFCLNLLQNLAKQTDENADEWTEESATDATVLRGPGGKRRHAEAFQIASITSTSATDDKLKRYWSSRHMLGVLENLSKLLTEPCVLSSAVDGARMGRPLRELLMHWVWLPAAEVCAVLPPLVRGRQINVLVKPLPKDPENRNHPHHPENVTRSPQAVS
eukprot:4097589-Amphidinium_carterae.3